MNTNLIGKGERLAEPKSSIAGAGGPVAADPSGGLAPDESPAQAATDEQTPADADDDAAPNRRPGKAGARNRAAGRAGARNRAGKNQLEQDATPQVIEIRPMAKKAQMRKRHWGVLAAFLLMVALPVTATGYYLFAIATDQYASTSGFSVRKEEVGSPAELMGGLSQFMGGAGGGDADMLYEFIQSQDLVTVLDNRLDLRTHYTAPYSRDPVFSLKPGGTVEDLVDYWHRIVKVSYDQGTGLISLHVRAFSPEMAQELSKEILAESQVLVNQLNATARADMLRYAEQDLADAVARLKVSREALVHFRTRTQIVDPESDLQGRMGVLASLQQQLAQALIEYDLVAQDSSAEDPRVTSSARRIEVIQDRIREERQTFSENEPGQGSEAYPALLAEYESLMVDREYSEGAYAASLAALDIARANAARQSRYLATYIKPTYPERADYPQRGIIFGLATLFFVLFWTISSLMYYALRDRK